MKYFNTAGPVNCKDHYCLPPLSRFHLPEILRLISQKKYFVLHAPRQSGKTSCLLALEDYLNASESYKSLYINVESAQAARNNVEKGISAIITEIERRIELSGLGLDSQRIVKELFDPHLSLSALNSALTRLAESSPLPFVLLIDEIDALVGDTLISVLRQIRSGYDTRPDHFPSTVILCGVRDVRDYRIQSDTEQMIITGGSAFNIKAESLRIGNFSKEEVRTLSLEHTKETGQVFTTDALNAIWDLTSGQPWLVNALAYETCFKLELGKNPDNPITDCMVEQAKENLIIRRETHLDQLADKLKEERVRRVIEPILTGDLYEGMLRADDIEYVKDLGLITQAPNGEISISNRIYQEIIPRQLSWESQSGMALKQAWFIDDDGRLNISKLIGEFQQFFREHSESWIERFQYKEAGPEILLQAFLQRIVNGGGQIDREYGLGRTRTDLYVRWPLQDGTVQRIIIELKILYKSREQTIEDGMKQVCKYADRCGADEAHIIVFDRRPEVPWDKKIFQDTRIDIGSEDKMNQCSVEIWGM
ncbi:MAG: ATP-binding protein [Methanomicrobiales archaeon]|nr:ATP-binding protein [Methanomicrobiales archaeon]